MSYLHADYAAAMSTFGSPRWLPSSQGWVLVRGVPGSDRLDAAGCYPLFRCRDWTRLADDAAVLADDGLVSLVLVCDPLADLEDGSPASGLEIAPYKDHFVTDLAADPATTASAHHLRNARRFLRHGDVVACERPADHLDDWCRLYGHLVARHRVTGPAVFSREIFARQLALPGARLWRAELDGEAVGMQLWFRDDDRADHHLSGYDEAGYRWGGASYALMHRALDDLRADGVRTALLGSGAGLAHDPDDGLSRFKAGWSTRTATARLVKAILDPDAYRRLVDGAPRDGYFPAYRHPEREVSHAS